MKSKIFVLIFCLLASLFLLLNYKLLAKHSSFFLKPSSFKSDLLNVTIPEIIHQSWKTPTLPEDFQLWQKSWKKCYPLWEYRLWTDEDNENFVKNKFPQYYEMYKNFTSNIYRVDTVRYMYLYEYGGIYTDMDTECLKPFSHLLNWPLTFGGMERDENNLPPELSYIQNSFMVSAAKEPFWLELIEVIKSKPPDDAEVTTGPKVLNQLISEHLALRDVTIKVYDSSYFNPWSWLLPNPKGCTTGGRMTIQDTIVCKANFVNSYVIQYHTHRWKL